MDKRVGIAIAILVGGALLLGAFGTDFFASPPVVATPVRPAVAPHAPAVVAPPVVPPVVRAAPVPRVPPDDPSTREVTVVGPDGTTTIVSADGTVISTRTAPSADGDGVPEPDATR
jgi:hypothetical protein